MKLRDLALAAILALAPAPSYAGDIQQKTPQTQEDSGYYSKDKLLNDGLLRPESSRKKKTQTQKISVQEEKKKVTDYRNYKTIENLIITTKNEKYKVVKDEKAGIKDLQSIVKESKFEGVWFYTPKDTTWYWGTFSTLAETHAQIDIDLFNELIKDHDSMIIYHNHPSVFRKSKDAGKDSDISMIKNIFYRDGPTPATPSIFDIFALLYTSFKGHLEKKPVSITHKIASIYGVTELNTTVKGLNYLQYRLNDANLLMMGPEYLFNRDKFPEIFLNQINLIAYILGADLVTRIQDIQDEKIYRKGSLIKNQLERKKHDIPYINGKVKKFFDDFNHRYVDVTFKSYDALEKKNIQPETKKKS